MQVNNRHISLWYAALSGQPDAVRKDVTDALLRYAFDGIEPEFADPVCNALFYALWSAAENLPEEEIVMEKRPGAPKGNRNAKKQTKKQFKTIQNNSGNCFNCFSEAEEDACNELNISGKTIQNNSDNCFNCFSEEETPLSSPSLSPIPPITPPIIPLTPHLETRACARTCEEVLPEGGTCSAEAATECPPPTPSHVANTPVETNAIEAEEVRTAADTPCFSREDILNREKSKQDIQHITLWLTQDINRLRVTLSHTGIPPNELVRDEQVRTRAKPFIEEYYYQQFERGKDNISTRGRTDIINHFACWLPRYCSRMTEQNNQQHGEFRNNNPTRAGTGIRPDDFARSFSLGFLSGRGASG